MTSFCENVHCFWKNLCLNEHNVLRLALDFDRKDSISQWLFLGQKLQCREVVL